MAEVLPWHGTAQPEEVVRRAAAALAEGRLVGFPTETVYGIAANALIPEAVARLTTSKGRPVEKALTVAIPDAAAAAVWVPDMSPLGQRLARRCWPGPVTLVFGTGLEHGLLDQLPEEVRRRISPKGTLGLRVPAHPAILETLERVSFPVVLTSANRSGEPAATTAAEVQAALGEELDLLIDDGTCHFKQASTVVEVAGDSWRILREGVVTEEELRRLTPCVIAFVCTGNTCRSPMAEALCKRLLAERIGCTVTELPERGYVVLSAGVAAVRGAGASPEAVAAVQELGGDLTGHASRPLTAALAAQADYLVAMTRSHLEILHTHAEYLAGEPRLLSPHGDDIADPFGGDLAVYQECAKQIQVHLHTFVAEVHPS
jgi:protein-tyrosine phosphatase